MKNIKRLLSFLVLFTFLLNQTVPSFAINNLGAAVVSGSDAMGTGRAALRSAVLKKADPNAIANGECLEELSRGELPPRLASSNDHVLPKESPFIPVRDKVLRATQLAISLLMKAMEENAHEPIEPVYRQHAQMTLKNLFTLQREIAEKLWLFNADIRGLENYRLGFNTYEKDESGRNTTDDLEYAGLSIELIKGLPLRFLAQYITHECIPEKGIVISATAAKGDERDPHRTVIEKIHIPTYGKTDVDALKRRFRYFIDSNGEDLRPDLAAEERPITQAEATNRLNALPTIGKLRSLKAFFTWVKSQPKVSYEDILARLEPELEEMDNILRAVRPEDEFNQLLEIDHSMRERQLDILRGISELILQFLPEERGEDNIERLTRIKTILVKNSEITKLLITYFETKFNPELETVKRGEDAARIRAEIGNLTSTLNGEEHYILQLALGIIISTIRTNYYVNERINLFFRLDPRVLTPYDHKGVLRFAPPYGIIWIHVPYGVYGVHTRYADVARGGLRQLVPTRHRLRNKVLSECVALTLVQHIKHIDIPEGGSKGAYIFEEGLNEIAAGLAYITGLIACMKRNPRIVVAAGSMQDTDPLELGPDEGTRDLADLASMQACRYGLEDSWRLFMSGKLAIFGGVSHKTNNLLNPPRKGNRVTSQGVWVHARELIRYLHAIGKIQRKTITDPIRFSVTGDMTGDVASGLVENAIHNYGDSARILCISGVSAVGFDPKGFDNYELKDLYERSALITEYPAYKLNKGGFVFNVKEGNQEGSFVILEEETLKHLNSRIFDPEVINRIGLNQDRYRKEAKLENGEPLCVVLEWQKNGLPKRVKVHSVYLREMLFFLVRSDMLLTGGGLKDSINDNNWELFFDEFGKPVASAICHGANVFITAQANNKMEEAGVLIWPDEKANSLGVEISSRMEMDFNMLYELEGVTRPLMASYYGQVLAKAKVSAAKKFWYLLLERVRRPDANLVTGTSRRISMEVIRLANIIRDSDLVGATQSTCHPGVKRLLKEYFPDVTDHDTEYSTLTLQRVFNKMPGERIKAIAAKTLAREMVLALGPQGVQTLVSETGETEVNVAWAFLNTIHELDLFERQRKIIENVETKEGLSVFEQLERLEELRQRTVEDVRKKLRIKTKKASPTSRLTDDEIRYNALLLFNMVRAHVAKNPKEKLYLGIDTELGEVRNEANLTPLFRVCDRLQEIFPDNVVTVKAEGVLLVDALTEATGGDFSKTGIVTRLSHSDIYQKMRGKEDSRPCIVAINYESQDLMYLPVIEGGTLALMMVLGVNEQAILHFYNRVSLVKMTLQEMREMLENKLLELLPKISYGDNAGALLDKNNAVKGIYFSV